MPCLPEKAGFESDPGGKGRAEFSPNRVINFKFRVGPAAGTNKSSGDGRREGGKTGGGVFAMAAADFF